MSRSRAMLFEYPIRPVAIRPIVILFDSTKGPPSFGMRPFHDTSIITGTINVNITARRLRHCVVRSARNNVFNMVDVFGIEVSIEINYKLAN